MPRRARGKSETGIYHVILRGINRQQIFNDGEDYRKFLDIMNRCKSLSHFELYAYCLMGNHIHLLIKPEDEPLEQIFKRVGCRFVYWYNAKYGRVGHLFQDRYKSEAVDSDRYFLTVLRYIHFNPVKAGLSDSVFSYRFSSGSEYLWGKSELVDIDFAQKMIGRKELLEFLGSHSEDQCMEIESSNSRISDQEAAALINQTAKTVDPADMQAYPPEERKKLISELRTRGLSIRQISRLTGIGVGVVRKA